MNKERLRRLKETAIKMAYTSEGTGTGNYRIGAVLSSKKGMIKAKGFNSYKTHTFLAKFYDYPFHHAEAACILNCGLDNITNSDIICVARIGNKNQLLLSKPCESCQELLKFAGIKSVLFSTSKGTFEYINLDNESRQEVA